MYLKKRLHKFILNYGIILFSYFGKYKVYKKGWKIHKKDGPAIIYFDGTKEWWQNGELYREDGPTKEYNDGHKFWYNKKDMIHRTDGPAVIYASNNKHYWLLNKYVSEKIFNSWIKRLKQIYKLKYDL